MKRNPLIRIESAGAGLSIQDRGRRGWLKFGVPPGGAMDPRAALHANRLAGNPPSAPLLEIYRLGARLRFLSPALIALAGAAPFRSLAGWRTHRVAEGDVLCASEESPGAWAYLAVPGGFGSPLWLGSASANPRAGFGAWLTAGDELFPEGDPNPRLPGIGSRFSAPEIPCNYDEPPVLRAHTGPQAADFSRRARKVFFETEWRVSPDSDRSGYRLEGAFIDAPPEGMESEPVLAGSVQIPPGGQPLVTMPDGPTVGGYHKIAVIDPEDLFWLAQCKPGQVVRFRPAEEDAPAAAEAATGDQG